MNNATTAKGIVTILVFALGFALGFWIAPEERIVENTVEVEKVIEIPATNQDVYDHCTLQARRVLYTSMREDPKDGVTPQNTQDFIDDCFDKLTTNHE